ncbi:hypothetical protein [Paenibacillus sedimenti]|uniref:Uncharacterized protein n=1 Tax=Paenibacillus sedimenti TaxID=2770274 RepID=A0A926KTX2_9BACL|nr:hypothetical protein [Paenibacillus sedimenti]MBD0382821.1 hypothetical protein [Paenibacillus sedimenti]
MQHLSPALECVYHIHPEFEDEERNVILSDILEQGQRLKVTFEDNTSVESEMKYEKAYIIDHPTGEVTNSSKAKVEIFNNQNEELLE